MLLTVFWKFLQLTNLKENETSIKLYLIKFFISLIFLQLIIGAFVSGMDAGKIYNSWPLMGSNFFPDDSRYSELLSFKVFDNPSIVQFLHRLLAYLIVINYIYILILAFKEKNKVLLKPVLIIGIILLFQVGLGILTILSGVKIVYASLHQINSIFVILSTLYFLYISKYKDVIN